MLRQILLGGGVSIITIVIHAVTMAILIHVGRKLLRDRHAWPVGRGMAVMVTTVAILMLVHVVEIIVWSIAYNLADVAPAGTDLLYFAFVNYTTLGYGDVVPLERWRLIGPITALNGVVLIGWSTAVIFEVLRVIVRAHDQ
jgi:hypothetical protein